MLGLARLPAAQELLQKASAAPSPEKPKPAPACTFTVSVVLDAARAQQTLKPLVAVWTGEALPTLSGLQGFTGGCLLYQKGNVLLRSMWESKGLGRRALAKIAQVHVAPHVMRVLVRSLRLFGDSVSNGLFADLGLARAPGGCAGRTGTR